MAMFTIKIAGTGVVSTRSNVDCAGYDSSVIPVATRACNTQACILANYVPQDWGRCSHECGGIRTRAVDCIGRDVHGKVRSRAPEVE